MHFSVEVSVESTIWCGTYLVLMPGTGIQVSTHFTYCENESSADGIMHGFLSNQPGVSNVMVVSLKPLDRRHKYKSDSEVWSFVVALSQLGFKFINPDSKSQAGIADLHKTLIPISLS